MSVDLNYISNYALEDTGGGWNGNNRNIYHGLSSKLDANYVGPINPPIPLGPKIVSKLLRLLGHPGAMPVFGRERLGQIAEAYMQERALDAKFDHFHGATPWAYCKPPCPYSVYIDATFPQYMNVFSDKSAFRDADLDRITHDEAKFLSHADIVFFGSEWVRKDALDRYGLDQNATRVVYAGGNIPLPEQDRYAGASTFLFVSLNFERKGGFIAVQAIETIRRDVMPNAELVILGEQPPKEILSKAGIHYGGRLRKSEPTELAKLIQHFSTARALIHPTSQDTMGQVLIECAYHGCPAVTTKDFGVPEFVLDGKTGYLVPSPANVNDVTNALALLCEDTTAYSDLRANAFVHSHENLTFGVMTTRMAESIREILV